MDHESNNNHTMENYQIPISGDESGEYRGAGSYRADSSHADSYAEMVEEIETVTQQLKIARQRLWETQDQLKESNARIEVLENRLATSQTDNVNIRLLQEEKRALVNEESKLYDEIAMLRDRNNILQGSERQLKKAVELLQKDISASREKYRQSESSVKSLKTKLQEVEGRLNSNGLDTEKAKTQLQNREQHLKEAQEETAKLVEEVATLRDELRSTKATANEKEEATLERVIKQYKERLTLEVRNKVTKQVTLKVTREVKEEMKQEREKEFTSLREQFKKLFKENSELKEKIGKAEPSHSIVPVGAFAPRLCYFV